MRNLIAGFFLVVAGLWGQCSTLSTVTPNSVSQGSGVTQVNFTGASFQPNEQIIVVYSGSSTQPVPTTITSQTTGNAVIPASAFVNAGTVQIFLGPPCQSNPLNITVTAQPQSCPTLTSLTPNTIEGVVVGTVEVDAAGSNFRQGDQAVLSGTVVESTVVSDKYARVFIPASLAAGTYLFSLNRSGCPPSNSLPLTITPAAQQNCPTLSSVTLSGNNGVTLIGGNFQAGDQALISGSGFPIAPMQTTINGSTQASAQLPAGLPPGNYTISIYRPGSMCPGSNTVQITIPPIGSGSTCPTLSTVTLSSPNGLTLTGGNFQSGDQALISGPGFPIAPMQTTIGSGTQATAQLPAGIPPGNYTVTIYRPGSLCPGSNTVQVTIPPLGIGGNCPSLSAVLPATVAASGTGFTVTLSGSNFSAGMQVAISGPGLRLTPLVTSSINAGQATVTVFGNLPPGTYSIVVTGSGSCGASNAVTLTITAGACAALTSVSPATFQATTGTVTITMTGTGFSAGIVAYLASIQLLPIPVALPTSFVSPTSATTTFFDVPPGTFLIFMVSANSQCGPTNTVSFTVTQPQNCPVPQLAVPSSIPAGNGDTSLTVTGANFVDGDFFTWAGATASTRLATMVTSPTRATVLVNGFLLVAGGPYALTASNPSRFCVASPPIFITVTGVQQSACAVISALSPMRILQGSGNTLLTVMGSNFTALDVVVAGGDPIPTTFSSSSMLTAMLPAGKTMTAGMVPVVVRRSGSQCGDTMTVVITIQPLSNGLGLPSGGANRSGQFDFPIGPYDGAPGALVIGPVAPGPDGFFFFGPSCPTTDFLGIDQDCNGCVDEGACGPAPGCTDGLGIDCGGPTPVCTGEGDCGGSSRACTDDIDRDCGGCGGRSCGGLGPVCTDPRIPGVCDPTPGCGGNSCGGFGPVCTTPEPPEDCSYGRHLPPLTGDPLPPGLLAIPYGISPADAFRAISNLPPATAPDSNSLQKAWLPANFRFRLNGLDEPCSRVNKIEPIFPRASVNTFNFNFFLCQPIVSEPGQAFPLQLNLFYNSESNEDGPFGMKWRHSYQMHLITDNPLGGGTVVLESADGVNYYYNPDKSREGGFFTPGGAPGALTLNPDGTYRLVAFDTNVVYRFDKGGNWTQKFDPSTGATQNITYQNGNVANVTDSNGRSLQFQYQGSTLSSIFDDQGNLLAQPQIDTNHLMTGLNLFGGINYQYIYAGGSGQMIQLVDPSGNTALQLGYNNKGGVIYLQDPAGNLVRFVPQPNGSSTQITGPDGATWTHQFDASGRLLIATDPLNSTIHLSYTPQNDIGRITNPFGDDFLIAYNDSHQPTSVTFGDRKEGTTYSTDGKPLEYTDAYGNKTQYLYDASGKLVKVTGPDGSMTTYTYDDHGRVLTKTDPTGRTITYTYDAQGNPTGGYSLSLTTQRGYDSLGRLAQTTNAIGGVTQYMWDSRNLLSGITFADGSAVSYEYDANGNLVRRTDPKGTVTKIQYDVRNLPVQVTQAADTPDERSYVFGWDAYRRPISLLDPARDETDWMYDAAGRLVRRSNPAGVTQFNYDAGGRVISLISPNGNTVTYSYNLYGALTQYSTGDSPVSYTYDIGGNRASMTDSRGKTSYEYDKMGRLVRIVTPDALEVQRGYDAAGRLTTLTYPDPTIAASSYDEDGRLKAVADGSGGMAVYSYDLPGRTISIVMPDAVTVKQQYDAMGRVAKVDNGLLSSFQYEYDANGNVVKEVSKSGTTLYEYDRLDRLIRVTPPSGGATTYSYDRSSRRIAVDGPAGLNPYSYDAAGRLVKAGDTSYRSDADGNTTSEQGSGAGIQYQYDSYDRLVRVSGGTSALYEYDGSGRRVQKQTAAGITQYSYDWRRRLLGESGPDGKLNYFYGRRRLWLSGPAGNLYYLYDGRGNVAQVVDGSGKIVEENAYDPFGVKLTPDATASPNKFGYRGATTDPETGLVYIGGRYYSPKLGRFLSLPY